MTNQPDPSTIAALKKALENYASGHTQTTAVDLEAEKDKAAVRTRALRLLDQRDRSHHELRTRLIDAEFPPSVIDEVLADFVRSGLLNDSRFAHEWVRQRHQRRGKSRKVLNMELKEKGVASAIRSDALSIIDSQDEEATAQALAEKKARSIKDAPADYAAYTKDLRRVLGVLARRGFPHEMSMRVAKEALDQRIQELDED